MIAVLLRWKNPTSKDGKKYAFHLLPCGMINKAGIVWPTGFSTHAAAPDQLFQACKNLIGNGVVVLEPHLAACMCCSGGTVDLATCRLCIGRQIEEVCSEAQVLIFPSTAQRRDLRSKLRWWCDSLLSGSAASSHDVLRLHSLTGGLASFVAHCGSGLGA